MPQQQSAKTTDVAGDDDSVKYGELNNHLGYFVRRAQHWIFRDGNARLVHLKIDVIRYSILELISNNPGISQIVISGALGIERARLVALLDELQKLHYLLRKRSLVDRRSHALHLTPQGIVVLKEANALIAQHEESVIKRIGPDVYHAVLNAMSAFKSG